MKLQTRRDTEETFNETTGKYTNKRLDSRTVWVFGTEAELDLFENFIEVPFENSNCQCREDGDRDEELSDYYHINNDDLKDFKEYYQSFKAQVKSLKTYEANGLKIEQEAIAFKGSLQFKVTIGEEVRVDTLDYSDSDDRRMIDYITGSKNIAKSYYSIIL